MTNLSGSDLTSTFSPSKPLMNDDGTVSAIIQSFSPLANNLPSAAGASLLARSSSITGYLLTVLLPPNVTLEPACGCFFMVRCTDDTVDARQNDWSIYLRRPLWIAGLPVVGSAGDFQRIDLLLTDPADPGSRKLLAPPQPRRINLIGPFGQPFSLSPHTRSLLVLTDPCWLPVWLPTVHTMLDRGGRVTLVVRGPDDFGPLLPLLPLAVELRASPSLAEWSRNLGETLRWADVFCCALSPADYQLLADQIRLARYRLEPDFAYAFVNADLGCGFGACLACVVSLPNGGMTRACLHGPIFPLDRLTN
jgi:hypothetical protein